MPEPEERSKIELPDILLVVGLVLFFVGLGLAVSWAWALAITGGVLMGLAVWLVVPQKPQKDKA